MNLRTDPGQVFESDEHRRVLATLPAAKHHPFGSIAEQEAEAREQGNLQDGQSIATSRTLTDLIRFIRVHDPNLNHITETDIEDVLKDLEEDGFASSKGGEWAMLKKGYDALNGPNGDEPPPLEGTRLDAAKAQDEAILKAAKDAIAESDPPVIRDYSGDQKANR